MLLDEVKITTSDLSKLIKEKRDEGQQVICKQLQYKTPEERLALMKSGIRYIFVLFFDGKEHILKNTLDESHYHIRIWLSEICDVYVGCAKP